MKLIPLLASLGIACGQLTITPSATNVQRGQSITLTANYGSVPIVSALQMEITPIAGVTFTAASGSRLLPAAKNLSCALVPTGVTGSGNYRCIVSGNTTSTLQSGDQIVYSFIVPALQPLGPLAINFSNIIGATPTGTDAGLPKTASVNLTVVKKFDLNGDGVIDLSDAKIALDQAMGTVACAAGDADGDKACTAIDIVLVLFNLGK